MISTRNCSCPPAITDAVRYTTRSKDSSLQVLLDHSDRMLGEMVFRTNRCVAQLQSRPVPRATSDPRQSAMAAVPRKRPEVALAIHTPSTPSDSYYLNSFAPLCSCASIRTLGRQSKGLPSPNDIRRWSPGEFKWGQQRKQTTPATHSRFYARSYLYRGGIPAASQKLQVDTCVPFAYGVLAALRGTSANACLKHLSAPVFLRFPLTRLLRYDRPR